MYFGNSAEENGHSRPDPIIQARDDSSEPGKEIQHTEIVPSVRKPMSVADGALVPSQFMGTEVPTQTMPSGNDIIESMFRYKWTILIVFVLVAVPAIAAIWTQIVPEYKARAEVRVRPIIPTLVFRTDDNGAIPFYEPFVNTQVSIIRSPYVLQRVLDTQEVQDTQWYKDPGQTLVQKLLGNQPDPPMERLRDVLSVQPRRRTEIIDVALLSTSGKDAKVIVNAVVDKYIGYVSEQSNITKDTLYRQLVEQFKSLENEILGREKEQTCHKSLYPVGESAWMRHKPA